MANNDHDINRLPTQCEFVEHGLAPYNEGSKLSEYPTCIICIKESNTCEERVVKILNCGHIFHYECLMHWFVSANQKRGTCLNCRNILFKPGPLLVGRLIERDASAQHALHHLYYQIDPQRGRPR